ncbi:predicted protein [Pyrenophora tritici-repentis Pt-1C-BFP]|uniref:Uncharacterized protein n=1 Tax=Pyrenophora tritici-repentis (strain Pt-1C-BFP) TaxID=426418 RepID=B2W8L0_PYRTR|nr:uncharacterized protein PTRG_06318 [Pyrenophora tritici-repentis Pt-1C-BFP]EDU49238.1 predicted protein [Pyrenophora tritici-repentis Pt-1C-BFP]
MVTEACGTARRLCLPAWLPSFFTSAASDRLVIVLHLRPPTRGDFKWRKWAERADPGI